MILGESEERSLVGHKTGVSCNTVLSGLVQRNLVDIQEQMITGMGSNTLNSI